MRRAFQVYIYCICPRWTPRPASCGHSNCAMWQDLGHPRGPSIFPFSWASLPGFGNFPTVAPPPVRLQPPSGHRTDTTVTTSQPIVDLDLEPAPASPLRLHILGHFLAPASPLRRGHQPRLTPLLLADHLSPGQTSAMAAIATTTPPFPTAYLPLCGHFSASRQVNSVDRHHHHPPHPPLCRPRSAAAPPCHRWHFPTTGIVIPFGPRLPATASMPPAQMNRPARQAD